MDRDELAARLRSEGVPETTYHLSGAHYDDRQVLDHRASGWFVFYSERGGEYDVKRFETEAAACMELYSRVRQHGSERGE